MYGVEGVDPAVRDSSFMSVPAEEKNSYHKYWSWIKGSLLVKLGMRYAQF
jgi:hypothetical protein